MTCMERALEPTRPNLGMGRSRKAPIKRFAEVISYSESAAYHKFKNGAWVGSSFMVFASQACFSPERRSL